MKPLMPIGTFLFASAELREMHERFNERAEFSYLCNTTVLRARVNE